MNELNRHETAAPRRGLSFAHAGRRAVLAGLLAGTLVFGLSGCMAASSDDAVGGGGETTASQPSDGSASASADGLRANVAAMDFEYSNRDTAGTYDEAEAVRVNLAAGTIEGDGAASGILTVSQEGTYILTGALVQGQVLAEADKDTAKVQLVLDGASIENATGPAIYVKSADKMFITTAEGTQNTLSSGANFQLEEGEDEPDATVFSKDDLTLNGKGALNIEGNYQNAVTSKDDLVIGGGTYVVTAVQHGLKGKDCVKMADGAVTVTAGGDGLKSTNDSETDRGFVSIDGGTLTVDAGDDGVDAQWYFRVMGGTVNVTAADDAFHSESDGLIGGGDITVNAGDDAFHTECELVVDDGNINVESCAEGYESQQVIVNGGYSNLVASDDAINAAVAEPYTGDVSTAAADNGASQSGAAQGADGAAGAAEGENRGKFSAPAEEQGAEGTQGAEGVQGDGRQFRGQRHDGSQGGGEAADGQGQQPPEMPEGGADGQTPPDMPQDGQMPQAPEGGFDGEASQGGGPRGGFGGGIMGEVSEDCLIQINGGVIIVRAGGDGLDSSGNRELNGGVVYVSDASTGADGALDYELEATSNGGTLIAAGPAGMAAGFTGGHAPFAMANVSGSAGQTIALVNGGGQVLASMEAQSAFQNVVVACPDAAEGDVLSLVVGGMVTGADAEGKGGTVTGGTAVEVTVSTTATQAGGMGGPGGGMGGRGGMGRGAQGNAGGQNLSGEVQA